MQQSWRILGGPTLALALIALVGTGRGEDTTRVNLLGEDLSAWRSDTAQWMMVGRAVMDPINSKLLATTPGKGVLVNGLTGRTKNLLSQFEHGDVEVHLEFMVPQGSKSGVFLQGRYEVQIRDSYGVEELKHSDCGGIHQRWANNCGFEGYPPRVNATRAPGEWQILDILFRAPCFDADGQKIAHARFVKVALNGVLIHEDVEVTGPTRAANFNDEKPVGPLMLQGDHGPVAFRNIWIKPLGS
jgi:hypothetical protein